MARDVHKYQEGSLLIEGRRKRKRRIPVYEEKPCRRKSHDAAMYGWFL
jgi:hypothetical protein